MLKDTFNLRLKSIIYTSSLELPRSKAALKGSRNNKNLIALKSFLLYYVKSLVKLIFAR